MSKKLTMCLMALALVAAAGSAAASTIGWGNLQWPFTVTDPACSGTGIFGQVWKSGVTDSAGQGAGITAELGFGPVNSTPGAGWVWLPAVFNVDVGNNDEYVVWMSTYLPAGTYHYTFRYQYVGDGDWYYASERGTATIIQNCGAVPSTSAAWGSVKAMY
jgi:hypothetical protein